MAADSQAHAALALHRFGLGPRTGSIAAIASDPRGALLAEIDKPDGGRIFDPELMPSSKAATAAFNFREERQARRLAVEAQKQAMAAGDMDKSMEPKMEMESAEPKKDGPDLPQQIFRGEVKARLDAAFRADIGFAERLVWFWSNHFCISADNVPNLAGGYEREAIRFHVLGRFADMLLAVEGHPAMLSYLDNARSIGPNSVAGLINKRGLNENLAREILELHTLGVRTGYSQEDVTRLAKIITGWTIVPPATDPEHGNEFIFNPRMHEPGPQTVLGKTYAQAGVDQGRAVFADIARHPATAAHVAGKLARHFVSDEPPQPLVDKLARKFLDTDGDLKELARTLVTSPEAWGVQRTKLKRPGEWLMAILRATAIKPDAGRMLQAHVLLGEPLWRPPAPAGFSDQSAAWLDGIAQRADVANQFSERIAANLDPTEIMDQALGPLASAETRQTVARAESRPQALTLLLMSPEFQRR